MHFELPKILIFTKFQNYIVRFIKSIRFKVAHMVEQGFVKYILV